ncbi:hypothetical protein WA026_022977 [Henosepilachna vigintioctopunctata]|uniref:Uncharacterized protein n=1 Tax=Henosepilachna vigintioctopunctata TaxID=420089 RepID=A0AAW1TYX9_9CUCU
MTIILQNIQFIGNSILQLENFLNGQDVDILALTEHWKSKNELKNYEIPGFSMADAYCRESSRHDSSVIYCKDYVEHKTRVDIQSLSVPFIF